jgi:hypothetical protein
MTSCHVGEKVTTERGDHREQTAHETRRSRTHPPSARGSQTGSEQARRHQWSCGHLREPDYQASHTSARAAALITLLEDVPPPVLASLLGLHPATAERRARDAQPDWTAYLDARTVTGAS